MVREVVRVRVRSGDGAVASLRRFLGEPVERCPSLAPARLPPVRLPHSTRAVSVVFRRSLLNCLRVTYAAALVFKIKIVPHWRNPEYPAWSSQHGSTARSCSLRMRAAFLGLLCTAVARPACEVRLNGSCPALSYMVGDWFHDHLFGGPSASDANACHRERQDAWRAACGSATSTVESRFVSSRYGNLCDLDCAPPAAECRLPMVRNLDDMLAAASHTPRASDDLSVPVRHLFRAARWVNRSSPLSRACLMGRGGTFVSAAKSLASQSEVQLCTCLPKGIAAQLRLFDVVGVSGALLWRLPAQLIIRSNKTRHHHQKHDRRYSEDDERVRLGVSCAVVEPFAWLPHLAQLT